MFMPFFLLKTVFAGGLSKPEFEDVFSGFLIGFFCVKTVYGLRLCWLLLTGVLKLYGYASA